MTSEKSCVNKQVYGCAYAGVLKRVELQKRACNDILLLK